MKDEIIYILDRSGSMATIIEDAIGGFNTNLKEQKAIGDANVTVILFDDRYEVLYNRVPIKEVKEIDSKSYVPRGSTALLDAIGRTISKAKTAFKGCCEECSPKKVSVIIITDGYENASIEYKRSTIKEMIEHQQKVHDWQVLFVAANQDAVVEGAAIGIIRESAINFAATGKGVRHAYAETSRSLGSYRTKE